MGDAQRFQRKSMNKVMFTEKCCLYLDILIGEIKLVSRHKYKAFPPKTAGFSRS